MCVQRQVLYTLQSNDFDHWAWLPLSSLAPYRPQVGVDAAVYRKQLGSEEILVPPLATEPIMLRAEGTISQHVGIWNRPKASEQAGNGKRASWQWQAGLTPMLRVSIMDTYEEKLRVPMI